MDLNEAKYKDIRQRLFAIQLALQNARKFGDTGVLVDLKKQHGDIKKELAKFKIEQKESRGKIA